MAQLFPAMNYCSLVRNFGTCSPTKANIWLLHALLYRYNTVFVPLCDEVLLQVSILKCISLEWHLTIDLSTEIF